MNRGMIAVIGAVALLAVFAGGIALYERSQSAKLAAASAAYASPPFVREHSPTLGPDDARVVLVEFFDPG